jgi:hypothetical protein
VAAARKTRRFFGAKSNDILPGIFLGVFVIRTDSGCCWCCRLFFLLFVLVPVLLSVLYQLDTSRLICMRFASPWWLEIDIIVEWIVEFSWHESWKKPSSDQFGCWWKAKVS